MSTATLWNVLEISANVILGVVTIVLAIRLKYPGRITFVKEQTIALFDEIARNLSDLSVLYRQQPISPDVVLVRAALVNDGKKDLAKSMVHRPVTLVLPDGCKWLSATDISSSKDIGASIRQAQGTKVTISFDLLKRNECILFQVLAEVPATSADKGTKRNRSLEKRFDEALKFDLRIEETRDIRRVPLRGMKRRKADVRLYRVLLVLGAVPLALAALVTFGSGHYKRLAFPFKQASGKPILVTAEPIGSFLSVRSTDGSYHAFMSPEDFLKKYSGSPTVVSIRERWTSGARSVSIALAVIGISYIVMAFYLWVRDLSDRELRRILTKAQSAVSAE